MPKNKLMITKSNGQIVPFSESKIKESILRTGVDIKTAEVVLSQIKKSLKPKISTSEIFQKVHNELQKSKPWAAARFQLRQAIFKLGPAGFNFEKYVSSVLSAYGYKTATPDVYQGACITHEIDVTAEKEGRTSFIEAKFRHDFKAKINIKDTMSTWTRFLDLVDGAKVGTCPHFDEAWIVTNASFTEQSLQFGHCKNMMLIGWNHPKERTFAQMIDLDSLYPITILPQLKKTELEQFANADIMLCRDLTDFNADSLQRMTGIKPKRIDVILEKCYSIINGDNT